MLTGEQLTKETHLVIATPCYGGQVFQNYFMSIIKLIFLCNAHNIPLSFLVRGGDSLIPRIRNSIVAEVLANPTFTHLLWIDADIGFDPESIIRLLAVDRDVVCGLYPLKKLVWPETIPQDMTRDQWEARYTHYPYNPVPGAKIDEQGFIEVLDAPTGMMMIKRGVLEKLCEAYPGLKYTPDHMLGMEGIKDAIKDHHYRLFDVMTEENGRYLSEDYAFCADSQTRVETEEGTKTIKWIVDNQYSGRVRSMDISTGELRWNRVVDHMVRRNGKRGDASTKKTWMRMNTDGDNNTRAKLICTTDHRVAVIDDIMQPVIRYVEAKNSNGKWIVRDPSGNRKNHNENVVFNHEQLSVLVGTLLGDASIPRRGQLSITHCAAQREYLNHKHAILGGTTTAGTNSGFGTGKAMAKLIVPVNAQTRHLRRLCYSTKKTCLPLIKYINPMAMAFWYMDDGSRKQNGATTLHTNGFTLEENRALVEHLFSFGIKSSIHNKMVSYRGEQKKYYQIYLNAETRDRFFDLIAPFVHETMNYKLPDTHREIEKHRFNTEPMGYSAAWVKSTTEMPTHSSKLYDIEVEQDHNFIANGTLIHNCRRWQNIGGKIYIDAQSNLSHQGGHLYTGNFLESLKARHIQHEAGLPEDVAGPHSNQG